MYTFRVMPATVRISKSGQLDGIMDMFNVKSYWAALRGRIGELQALGLKISTYQQRIAIAQQKLFARKTEEGDRYAHALDDELTKINDDLQKWWRVKGYIDKYLPQWMGLDNNGVTNGPTSGVGFIQIPVVLAGMALVALAYCVNTGLALLQDYAYKSQLTQDVIDNKLTTGQMTDILSIPRTTGGVFESVIGKVGIGAGIGIPTALIVGGALYVAFSTGLLNKVVNMLPFGRST